MLDHVEIIYDNGNNNYIIDREMWYDSPDLGCYDSPDLGCYEEWLVNKIVDFITFNSDYKILPYEEYTIDFVNVRVRDCAIAYRVVSEVIYHLIFDGIFHSECEVPIKIKFHNVKIL